MYEKNLEIEEIISFEHNGIKKNIFRIIMFEKSVKLEYFAENPFGREYGLLNICDLPSNIKEFLKSKFCEFFI